MLNSRKKEIKKEKNKFTVLYKKVYIKHLHFIHTVLNSKACCSDEKNKKKEKKIIKKRLNNLHSIQINISRFFLICHLKFLCLHHYFYYSCLKHQQEKNFFKHLYFYCHSLYKLFYFFVIINELI